MLKPGPRWLMAPAPSGCGAGPPPWTCSGTCPSRSARRAQLPVSGAMKEGGGLRRLLRACFCRLPGSAIFAAQKDEPPRPSAQRRPPRAPAPAPAAARVLRACERGRRDATSVSGDLRRAVPVPSGVAGRRGRASTRSLDPSCPGRRSCGGEAAWAPHPARWPRGRRTGHSSVVWQNAWAFLRAKRWSGRLVEALFPSLPWWQKTPKGANSSSDSQPHRSPLGRSPLLNKCRPAGSGPRGSGTRWCWGESGGFASGGDDHQVASSRWRRACSPGTLGTERVPLGFRRWGDSPFAAPRRGNTAFGLEGSALQPAPGMPVWRRRWASATKKGLFCAHQRLGLAFRAHTASQSVGPFWSFIFLPLLPLLPPRAIVEGTRASEQLGRVCLWLGSAILFHNNCSYTCG
jgi:hypothetical protein